MKKMMMLAVLSAVGLTSMKAAEVDMGFYKFERKDARQTVSLSDETKLLTFIPQVHIPHGKGYRWGNFSYPKGAKLVRKDGNVEFSNTGFYRKDLAQKSVGLNANLQVDYHLVFTPEGKITADYQFTNNGDAVFLEPYCNVKLNPELLKNQEGTIYKINDVSKKVDFGEKLNTDSIDYRGGKAKDIHIEKMVLNSSLGSPFILEVDPAAHARLARRGEIMLYDTDHFAKHFWGQALDWKEFKKGESFSIKFTFQIPKVNGRVAKVVRSSKEVKKKDKVIEKTLPVVSQEKEDVDVFKYEAANKSQRAIIKNGTFYRDGKPVYFIGPWLSSHFFDYEREIPVPEYKDMPSHNKIFNADIAEEMGFNTCHPQNMGFKTLKDVGVFEHYPNYVKTREKYKDKTIKGYNNMPLVMDYAHIGWLFDNHWRKWFKDEIFQVNSQWHGFVPFSLAHPNSWSVQKSFWQNSVSLYLNKGANPWIYELFNEPAYDSRDKLTQKLFIEAMQKKYKDLDELNKRWNSNFKSYDEIISSTVVERQKGLQVEWFKFIEDHWVDILKNGKQAILEIDKRPNIYFSQQRGTSGSFLTTRHGFDEYKIARAMDVVNTEGGVTFNFGKAKKSDNPMDEYIDTHMNMHLDMCRAAAEEKPVIDTEQSTRRYSATGRRIPSKRSDMRLMLWNEVIHGSSMSLLYNWGKRSWQWKPYSLEGAEKFVNKPGHGWAAGCLLNPYCYPKDTLGGIKEFEGNIKELAEMVLPRPRIKGKVALLLSNPSRRYTGSIETEFTLLYQASTMTNMPKDVIFEEQLIKGLAENYKAIISPYSRYSDPATLPALKKYVENGGVVIFNGMDLSLDEYGKSIDGNTFMGLKGRRELTMPVPVKMKMNMERETGYPAGVIAAKMTVVPELADASVVAFSEERNMPLITLKTLGKGKIYYVACELNKGSWATVLSSIFKDSGIDKPFTVRSDEDGKLLPSVEAQVIDRGEKRLYYFANWNHISSIANLQINNITGDDWTLTLPNRNAFLKSPSGLDTWTSLELKNGVPVFCPGWDAQLLLLERGGKVSGNKISIDEFKAEFRQRKRLDEQYASNAASDMKRHKEREKELNNYIDVDKSNCVAIDISNHCNMAFKDEINGDKKGGTSDQGDNDLRALPVGKQVLAGVPFHVLDPEKNNGKSMITLRSKERPYFPEMVNGIPVNANYKSLYFLHAQLWGGREAEYIILYGDGTEQVIPVVSGQNIRGWWGPRRPKYGKVAWKGRNTQSSIGVYCWKWENPHPDKEIKSIDVKTKGMLLGTIAITGEK